MLWAMTLSVSFSFYGRRVWRLGDGRRAGSQAGGGAEMADRGSCCEAGDGPSWGRQAIVPFWPRVSQATGFDPQKASTFPRPGPK